VLLVECDEKKEQRRKKEIKNKVILISEIFRVLVISGDFIFQE
jgi:hypothetical protein